MTHVFGVNRIHYNYPLDTLKWPYSVEQLILNNSYSSHFVVRNLNSDFVKYKESDQTQYYLLGNPILYEDFDIIWESLDSSDFNSDSKKWFELFSHLNGIAAVLVVSINHIHVITDPLGFFPFFIFQIDDLWCWSSDMKSIIALPDVKLKYNEVAIYNYVHNGHFLDNDTWYDGISRLPAASVWTLDLANNKVQIDHYWTWNHWRQDKVGNMCSTNTYFSLLEKSIINLPIENIKIGISLSGGLDSRLIAAISKKYFDIHFFTFSTKRSLDLSCAKQVAKDLRSSLYHLELIYERWLEDRIFGFFLCDGMVPINHFHEGDIYKILQDKYDIIMTGFFGGGIYSNRNQVNTKITEKLARQFFYSYTGKHNINDLFYDFPSIDPYIIDQKIRNLAALHVFGLSSHFKVAIPFYNMDWLKYNYSIDEKYQANSSFYLKVINQFLSKPLRLIKWQKTRVAPYYQKLNSLLLQFRIPEIMNWVYQRLSKSRQFYNYTKLEQTVDLLLQKYKVNHIQLLVNFIPKNLAEKFNLLSVYLWLSKEKFDSNDSI